MDPLVHVILEPGNLECGEYEVQKPWNGGTQGLVAELCVKNFEPCTYCETVESALYCGSYCSRCVL